MSDKQQKEQLGKSPDQATINRERLAELFPEAFSEGKLDLQALKRTLGEEAVVEDGERYRLDWAGKRDAYKVLQTPTTATLRPERDKSLNFDAAQHVFIEGENLEVLKVLQKSYFSKVKLIYIDPPYNTGNDSFIYPDRFQENKEDYLKRINELDDDGTLMREGFFRKNSRENGHYHSNWLNMMLPRLYIARNLLREDGVIFVSCDDNEVHNLRYLMNEIFGEENLVSQIIWKKAYGGGAKSKHVVTLHEYVLCYARSKEDLGRIELPPNPEARKYYKLKDSKIESRGPYRLQPLATNSNDERENLRYPIPYKGVDIWPEKQWQWEKSRTMDALKNDELAFSKNNKNEWTVNYKQYLLDEDGEERGAKPFSLLEGPYTQTGTSELASVLGDSKIFPFPKPSELIRHFIEYAHPEKDFIVMDFFSGSASSAHAVLNQNLLDGGSRKFINIQLPEECDENSPAKKAGFETIADVSRYRILKVIEELNEKKDIASASNKQYFKSFNLTPSNFKQWRGDDIETAEQLAEQIRMFEKSDKEGADVEAMLYELFLRFGQELTTPVESLDIEGQRVFAIRERKMLFILDGFAEPMIDPILALKPESVLVLDSVFAGSDELKSNLELQCRDADIQFTCV